MQWTWLCLLIVLGLAPRSWSAEPTSPYVGQEQRELKAFSAEEIQGYLAGSGMGLAKVAELNHYPGPRHVLDLAAALKLSEAQQRQTQSVYDHMKTAAMQLGQQLLERERHLETLFQAGTIAETSLAQLVAEIATIQGQLRAVHLRAHLAQQQLLTPDQLRQYDVLRGYQTSGHHTPHHHGH